MSKQLTCPSCGSDRVTVTEESTLMANTLELWCHSVKAHDGDARAGCLDCSWSGQRQDLKTT